MPVQRPSAAERDRSLARAATGPISSQLNAVQTGGGAVRQRCRPAAPLAAGPRSAAARHAGTDRRRAARKTAAAARLPAPRGRLFAGVCCSFAADIGWRVASCRAGGSLGSGGRRPCHVDARCDVARTLPKWERASRRPILASVCARRAAASRRSGSSWQLAAGSWDAPVTGCSVDPAGARCAAGSLH